ncbi:MAG: undecaprenyl diphosphate synthase family protein [Bacteroidetes bacterium]|nr:undecaprenyl diphosphate synthase family protein [Bacteroidota bacterium]
MNEKRIRLLAIGDLDSLRNCQAELAEAIKDTSKIPGMSLVLALSYSSRWEIPNAMKKMQRSKAEQFHLKTMLRSFLIISY